MKDANAIVQHLLDTHPTCDMNHLARMGDLSYVDYRTYATAAEPNRNWCAGCSPDNCSGCGTFYEIKKQRDELLAALEEALPMVPCGSFDDYHLGLMATDRHMTAKMILRLRKLIARVKGKQ